MSEYEINFKDNALQISRYRFWTRQKLTIRYSDDQTLKEVRIRDGSHVYSMIYEPGKKTATHMYDGDMVRDKHGKSLYYSEVENELYFYGVNLTGYVDERDGLMYYYYSGMPYMVKENGIIRFIDNLRHHMFVIDAYPYRLIPDMPFDEYYHSLWLDFMRSLYDYLYALKGAPLKYFQHVFGNLTSEIIGDDYNIYKYTLHDERGRPVLKRITRMVDGMFYMDYVVNGKVVMQKLRVGDTMYYYPLTNNVLNVRDHYNIIDYMSDVTFVRTPYDYYYLTGNANISYQPYTGIPTDPDKLQLSEGAEEAMTYYLDINTGIVPWDINNRMKEEDITL